MDAFAARRVPVFARRLHARFAVGERVDRLHDALAERNGAHKLRARAVAQRAREDLRRAGGVFVQDQHDGDVPRAGIGVIGQLAAVFVLAGEDHVVVDEDVGHGRGEIDVSAAVIAQVDDQPLHARLLEFLDGVLELRIQVALEVMDANVANVAVQHLAVDDLRFHDGARKRHVENFALAQNRQRYFPADLAAHDGNRLVQIVRGQVFAVYGDNFIVGPQAALLCGTAVKHAADGDRQVVGVGENLDAQPTVLACVGFFRVGYVGGGIVVGILVAQRTDHALRRAFKQRVYVVVPQIRRVDHLQNLFKLFVLLQAFVFVLVHAYLFGQRAAGNHCQGQHERQQLLHFQHFFISR